MAASKGRIKCSFFITKILLLSWLLIQVSFSPKNDERSLSTTILNPMVPKSSFFVDGADISFVSNRNTNEAQSEKSKAKNKDKKSKMRSKNEEVEITEEMIDLILKKVQPGGGVNGSPTKSRSSSSHSNGGGSRSSVNDGKEKKKRKRTRKYPSSSDASSSKVSSGNGNDINPLETMTSTVTVTIPGYGKAEGRRETAVDIWKGMVSNYV